MASLVKRVFTLRSGLSSGNSILMNTSRSIVYSESGSILQKPTRVRFGVIKVLLVVLPSIYVGGIISRTGAHLLEEHDIFVPESDDDDD